MNPRSTPHQHALADPEAREIMRRYIADETNSDYHQVAAELAQLGLDESTVRVLRGWARSLRNAR